MNNSIKEYVSEEAAGGGHSDRGLSWKGK